MHDAHHHHFGDVAWAVERMESAEREAWQKPDELIRALRLKPGDRVVDLGASTGFLARRAARAVGLSGTVLALDTEAGPLSYLHDRAREEGLANLHTRLVSHDDPGLAPGSVDVILMVNVLHHVEDRIALLAKLRTGLAPGGRLAIVEFLLKKIPTGPPRAERIPRRRMREELQQSGFSTVQERRFLPYQYVLIAAP